MLRPETCEHPCIKTAGLSVAYGSALVVEQLDLSVPMGALTALIGPNGSGKSTILRTLSGLLRPSQGAILLDGQSISRLSTREMARKVGVLSQGPAAPEGLTVRELVQQGRYPHRPLFSRWSEEDTSACDEALALTGMTEMHERQIDHLSGGQRQRAWIAMTLAQQTPVLLLDEPTTFLDLAHQIEVMELAVDLVRNRRKTIVAVLHDLNQAARYADYMIMLKAGKIVASAPPKEVMTADIIREVFDVSSTIIADPVTHTPMCIPLPNRS
ncbi:ABC transporter ATP-binding protein [Labrenzia sp. OB1]|uniref:ABC transporter ATP-binding protein n=1 Tax=Labrenzia sp. OB1 TaxID=1561204 RepID=UPI0007B2E26B|nr:ABC transporter ATP-binding protein [Labrenzia sp. OB1]KZM51808.1 ABC transporter [Labrenzia sp. OB1]